MLAQAGFCYLQKGAFYSGFSILQGNVDIHGVAPTVPRSFDDRSMIHLSSGVSTVVVGYVDLAKRPRSQKIVSDHHVVLGDLD